MSKLYGNLDTDCTQRKTSRGHRYVKSVARSWAGSVSVELNGNPDAPTVRIRTSEGSEGSPSRELHSGPLSELLRAEALTLYFPPEAVAEFEEEEEEAEEA
jgi:hypothetical protein